MQSIHFEEGRQDKKKNYLFGILWFRLNYFQIEVSWLHRNGKSEQDCELKLI